MALKRPWEFDNPLCADLGPANYYKEDDGGILSRDDAKKIRELCSKCKHLMDCAEWGIQKENFGIWGGLTTVERRKIRRRRRKAEVQ